MSIPYELEGSKDNPLVTERTLKYYTQALSVMLAGGATEDGEIPDLGALTDKFKYYIVKDSTGYKIVEA